MERSVTRDIVTIKENQETVEEAVLIMEEPLSIRVQGAPYSVVMRTPGEEKELAAGFCLSEGIIDTLNDIAALGHCAALDPNVVVLSLNPSRAEKVKEILARKTYVSQTSCGICGKEIIRDLEQSVSPISDQTPMDPGKLQRCLEELHQIQPLRKKTRAVHAAAIYARNYTLISCCEDVGRHNALDKAVGKLLMGSALDKAAFAVMSSRISYELVQKASRARIPLIAGVSRPTALAVNLAESLNMTLVSLSKTGGISVFTGKHRLISGG